MRPTGRVRLLLAATGAAVALLALVAASTSLRALPAPAARSPDVEEPAAAPPPADPEPAPLFPPTVSPTPTPAPPLPIRLHPDNPRYFLFRERPTVLVTSGEHYGAVLNAAFDYGRYLDELQANGLNLTRTFAGPYREPVGAFGIRGNTLAPRTPEEYVAPWVRSEVPGARDGGAKFDLDTWNPVYFARLRDFVAEAGRRGVVVELVLFSSMYWEAMWGLSPLNAANNVNGVGTVPASEVYRSPDAGLLAAQQALVRQIAWELRDADNLYYEIINEPYAETEGVAPSATPTWQAEMIATLADAESSFPARHLVAQNVSSANGFTMQAPNPSVSIFNFHLFSALNARLNYGLERALALDETGWGGTGDFTYRSGGWAFLLAGGAVYSHLDLSFTPEQEDGSFYPLPPDAPSGGGPALRRQLRVLKEFMESLPFTRMRPNDGLVRAGVPPGATAYALAQEGSAYAVYLAGGSQATLSLDLPAGSYLAEWVDTRTGEVVLAESFRHAGGPWILASPAYAEDIALRVLRSAEGARESDRAP